jgi:hypothetical protein
VPHSSQNFDSGWTVAPQFEQLASIGAAQLLQNFAPSRFSAPQFAQRIAVTLRRSQDGPD